ncbi:MAG: hypothetical protein ACJ780_23130, partial [Solirubrobacteraceae bacterium]
TARARAPLPTSAPTSPASSRCGHSECLRQELADAPRISVATMLPQAVDTPIFANAANYSGRRPRPIPPMLSAEEVGEGILRCARDPKREVTYRHLGRGVELLHSFLPRLYARVVPPAFSAGNYMSEPVPDGAGKCSSPRAPTTSTVGGAAGVAGSWRVPLWPPPGQACEVWLRAPGRS